MDNSKVANKDSLMDRIAYLKGRNKFVYKAPVESQYIPPVDLEKDGIYKLSTSLLHGDWLYNKYLDAVGDVRPWGFTGFLPWTFGNVIEEGANPIASSLNKGSHLE